MKRGAVIALVALSVAALSAVACSRPVRHARINKAQATTPAEVEAQMVMTQPGCSTSLGLLFPGLAQMCTRRSGLGLALAAAGAAELGTTIAVAKRQRGTLDERLKHPGAAIPLVAFQDLWAFGYFEPMMKRQLARRQLYAPPDSVSDMLAAPFNIQVLKKPEVWLGIAGMLAAGIGASLLVDESANADRFGDDPNIFGKTMDGKIGYPLAMATGTVLFSHVAVAEELIFRGAIQSGLARSMGEVRGWLLASVLFGGVHAINAFAIEDKDEQIDYLKYGVPFITVIGSYLGWIYRHNDYSLSPPIAVHFWYDLLLSATFFALNPQDSPISAKVRLRF